MSSLLQGESPLFIKFKALSQINTVVVTAKVSYFLRLIVSQCNNNIKALRVIKSKKVF